MANIVEFSGFNWLVKQSHTKVGPGPNFFSEKIVSLHNGELKLEVIQRDGNTYCSEIFLDKSLGYGKYIFQLSSRLDFLQDDLVLGLFTYDYNQLPPHCEIDIEFSRWGDPKKMNSQFVVHPSSHNGNTHRFETNLNGDFTTHIIEWRPLSIEFQSIHGHVELISEDNNLIQSWSYTGRDIPHPANERVHINFWKTHEKNTKKMLNGIYYVNIHKFIFEPI